VVDDLDALATRLAAAGHDCVSNHGELPGVQRFHAFDPFGNRLEFQQAS
jgi:predicted enzyme related to lactoylglutathione lyase